MYRVGDKVWARLSRQWFRARVTIILPDDEYIVRRWGNSFVVRSIDLAHRN